MGNCMGQKRIGKEDTGKGRAPKTPVKDQGDNAPSANEKEVEKEAKSKQPANNIQANESNDQNLNHSKKQDDKPEEVTKDSCKPEENKGNGNDAGSGVLTTSWVVFDEDDDQKSKQADRKTGEGAKENGLKLAEENQASEKKDGALKVDKQKTKTKEASAEPGKPVLQKNKDEKAFKGNGKQKEVVIKDDKKDKASQDSREEKAKKSEKVEQKKEGIEKAESASNSVKVLHEVKNGRIVATEKTKNETELERKPDELDAKEKKMQVLCKKMESYSKSLTTFGNVIDFEENIFMDQLLNKTILLEDIKICGREINGLIALSGDQKPSKVVVMCTTDSWKSKAEEEAIPFSSSYNINDFHGQRFFFSLFVPFAKSIEFAIECFVENKTYWDNNDTKNYFVENWKKENEPGKLIPRFLTPKHVAFAKFVQLKSVCVKSASAQNGEVNIKVATKKCLGTPPVVRYTLNNWESFSDVASVKDTEVLDQAPERGYDCYMVNFNVPKEAKLVFAINWNHEGKDEWDNNFGKNYEVTV
ncbi:uncharacterized protein LOC135681583 [Rhopilema esculentum]|uniref:uncharacterized protein LOC135681583 n=1 Tax=Rhopilema esculentum TaxID=499914 RepID=UPI0031E37D8C|eukprot:gene13790-4719_t